MRRPATFTVTFLLGSALAAGLLPPVAAPAPLGAADVLLALDRPAGGELARALRKVAPGLWAAEHIGVAAGPVPRDRLDELAAVPGVLAVTPNRQLPLPQAPATPVQVPVPANTVDPGVTGRGVTVAVVDTGVDGTHPDLEPAMRANVKFLDRRGPRKPVEGLANSDTTSGHGTHVASDALGRGTASGGRWRGMAPGADLVALGTGEGLSIDVRSVLRAYDWVIENRERYRIRVVNNSWGGDVFEPFEEHDPVNLATKAAHDAGIVVVFANGNAGDELTMSSYAAAPWVLPVGAGTLAGEVAEFSSGGIDADVMGDDFGPRTITGETRRPLQMGLYHPAVVAAGQDIVGARAAATLVPLLGTRRDAALPPGDQLRYTTASGTSMAAPEAAGAVALVLEANPALRPDDVRRVLQLTARPVAGVPFFRQGYGYLDPVAAVGLARRLAALAPAEVDRSLAEEQSARDQAVLDSLPRPLHTVIRHGDPLRPAAPTEPVTVEPGTGRLKVVSTAPDVPFPAGPTFTITVRDAAGHEIGRATRQPDQASQVLILDLDLTRGRIPAWGTWTVEISNGPLAAAVPAPELFTVIATFAAPAAPVTQLKLLE